MAEGTGLPPQLIKYWVAGPGAAKIAWNTPGDFERCRVNIQAEIAKDGKAPLPDRVISGLCATLHKLATGGSPGHGSAEQMGKH
jgi:hypothetical protein